MAPATTPLDFSLGTDALIMLQCPSVLMLQHRAMPALSACMLTLGLVWMTPLRPPWSEKCGPSAMLKFRRRSPAPVLLPLTLVTLMGTLLFATLILTRTLLLALCIGLLLVGTAMVIPLGRLEMILRLMIPMFTPSSVALVPSGLELIAFLGILGFTDLTIAIAAFPGRWLFVPIFIRLRYPFPFRVPNARPPPMRKFPALSLCDILVVAWHWIAGMACGLTYLSPSVVRLNLALVRIISMVTTVVTSPTCGCPVDGRVVVDLAGPVGGAVEPLVGMAGGALVLFVPVVNVVKLLLDVALDVSGGDGIGGRVVTPLQFDMGTGVAGTVGVFGVLVVDRCGVLYRK